MNEKEQLIEVLNAVKPGIDYEKEQHLVTDHILTSFDIVMLVAQINEAFSIELTPLDLERPENFEQCRGVLTLIKSQRGLNDVWGRIITHLGTFKICSAWNLGLFAHGGGLFDLLLCQRTL